MLGFPYLEYLSEKGHLKDGRVKILDIGAQNLMNCTVEKLTEFVIKYRDEPLSLDDQEEIKRLNYFSTPRPGERTLFLSELLDMTNIGYHAIDVCPAPATEIVDLNWQRLEKDRIGYFDIVLNFGTMEHVVDQTNGHIYMHDACKVGGIIFHQPPSIGFVNHGYFLYHPQFYYDLCETNGYGIDDIWYAPAGYTTALDPELPIRDPMTPLAVGEAVSPEANNTNYYNLNVVLRKNNGRPFTLGLELATSHSSVDTNVGVAYQDGFDIRRLQDQQAISSLAAETPQSTAESLQTRELLEIVRRRLPGHLKVLLSGGR